MIPKMVIVVTETDNLGSKIECIVWHHADASYPGDLIGQSIEEICDNGWFLSCWPRRGDCGWEWILLGEGVEAPKDE